MAVALVRNDPALAAVAAPLGGLAGYMAEQKLQFALQSIGHRASRIGKFLVRAAEEHEQVSPEELLSSLEDDSPERALFTEAAEAASQTHDEWKIDTLARAFVAGHRDPAKVDDYRMLIDVVRDLDPGHARLLAALSNPPSAYYTVEKIVERDPGLGSALPPLVERLVRSGLIRRDQSTATGGTRRWALTSLGLWCAALLIELGSISEPPSAHA